MSGPLTVWPHNNGRGEAWVEVGLSPAERDRLAWHIVGRLAVMPSTARHAVVSVIARALADRPVRLDPGQASDLAAELEEQAAVAQDQPWTVEDEADVIATARIEDRA